MREHEGKNSTGFNVGESKENEIHHKMSVDKAKDFC